MGIKDFLFNLRTAVKSLYTKADLNGQAQSLQVSDKMAAAITEWFRLFYLDETKKNPDKHKTRFVFISAQSKTENQTAVECDKEYMELRGNSAYIKLHDSQISISARYYASNHLWFNYSTAPRGLVVNSYAFGNCTNGGYGEVFAAKFNTVSDPSQKENIQELSDLNALAKIMGLRFYSYDYKNPLQDKSSEISANQFASDAPQTPHKIHEDIGIMATEAPTEIQSEDGEAIDLYAYISLTAKAVQELSAKVTAQGQEIEALKAELSALKQ